MNKQADYFEPKGEPRRSLQRESQCKIVMSSDLGTCWSTNRQFGSGRCSYVYSCHRPERDACEAVKVELTYAEYAYNKEIARTPDVKRMCRIQEIYDNRLITLNRKYNVPI